MFETLSADADRVPPPILAAIERRGRRRGRRQGATTVAAIVVLAIVAGVALTARTGPDRVAPDPAQPGPVPFHALRPVGPALPYAPGAPAPIPRVVTSVDGDRGYAEWAQPGGGIVVA